MSGSTFGIFGSLLPSVVGRIPVTLVNRGRRGGWVCVGGAESPLPRALFGGVFAAVAPLGEGRKSGALGGIGRPGRTRGRG